MNEVETNLKDLQAAEAKLLLQTYDRYPVMLTSGEGVYLRDETATNTWIS